MNNPAGSKTWFVPDAYYPVYSTGVFPSHEAICVLNTGKEDANIEITLYFEDRAVMEGFKAVCQAQRTNHIRIDKLMDANAKSVPKGVPYAMMVRSDVDVIVQYSRMDTTQAEMALMSVIAYPL